MSQESTKKTEVKAVKNSTAPTANGVVKSTEEAKKASDLKNTEAELKRLINPTAEQRLRSLEQMQILAKKYTFLKDKKDSLEKFILSNDGTKEKITLSNAQGFNFEVSNSQTIEKVLQVIESDLELFTMRAEQEILEFNV